MPCGAAKPSVTKKVIKTPVKAVPIRQPVMPRKGNNPGVRRPK